MTEEKARTSNIRLVKNGGVGEISICLFLFVVSYNFCFVLICFVMFVVNSER